MSYVSAATVSRTRTIMCIDIEKALSVACMYIVQIKRAFEIPPTDFVVLRGLRPGHYVPVFD